MAENFDITKTLTVTNDVYTIGDAVGGAITLPGIIRSGGAHAWITEIILSGVAAIPYQLWFFPTDIATPAADNAELALVAADIAKNDGVIAILATNYLAPKASFNVATLTPSSGANLPLEVTPTSGTSMIAYLQAMATTSPGTTTRTVRMKGVWLD